MKRARATSTLRVRRRGHALAATAVVAACVALAAPRGATACSQCAGDVAPTGTATLTLAPTTSASAPTAASTLRLSMDARGAFHWSQPHRNVQQEIFETRTTLGMAWSPNEWFTAFVALPLVYRRVSEPPMNTVETAGPGDVELQSRFRVWHAEGAFRHALYLTAGLKTPTAPDLLDAAGRARPPASQLGTGSWDPFAAVAYAGASGAVSLYGNVAARWPTVGRDGWLSGRSVQASAAVQYQFAPAFAGLLSVDGRWGETDHIGGGAVVNTGGGAVYVSPTVLLSPSPAWLIRLTVQVPVINAGFGVQSDSVGLQVGAVYTFGAATPVAPRPLPWASTQPAP